MKNSMRITPVFLILALAGCAHSFQQPADADYADKVKAGSVARKTARLAVMLGERTSDLGINGKNGTPADFYINRVFVGAISQGECMAIDLRPGTYELYMKERTSNAGTGSKNYKLVAGKTLYLTLDKRGHDAQAIGWAILTLGHFTATTWNVEFVNHSADGRQLIGDMKIVKPNDSVFQVHPLGSKIVPASEN